MLEISGRITFLVDEGYRMRPVSGAQVEVWDKALSPLECPPPVPTPPPLQGEAGPPIQICGDRLLATLFTNDDGTYRVVLRNVAQDGSGLDPYIVVYATDQTQVSVKRGWLGLPYHEKSGLIDRNSQGRYLHYDMTIKREDIRRAFHIYDQIRRVGFGKLREKVGWTPSQAVTVYWPHPCVFVDNACYYYGALYIPRKFYQGQVFDDDVLLHEFGHVVMSQMYGNNNYVIYACPGFSHYLDAHETKRCAWSEGWATFLQAMLQEDPGYTNEADGFAIDLETPIPARDLPPTSEPPVSNADNETAVAAVLWDIYDGIEATTEPADRLADGVNNGARGQGIWDLVNNTRPGFFFPSDFSDKPPNVETFWDEWVLHRGESAGKAACIFYDYWVFLDDKTPLPRGFCPETLEASYYNDTPAPYEIGGPITWETFTSFVLTREEPCVAFDTNTNPPAPGVNGTFWSARWEGLLLVPKNGEYVFHFDRLDDGARLYLDESETPVLESWLVQGPHDYSSAPVYLDAGLHKVKLEYAQGPAWQAGLFLGWEFPSDFSKEVVNSVMSGGICTYPTSEPSSSEAQATATPMWQSLPTPTTRP